MSENRNGRRARAWLAPVVAFVAAGALAGCDSLLDVENPNNLVDEDIQQPSSGNALSNGAMATVARGLGEYVAAAAMASDETTWIGSRDAWGDLDRGNVSNPSNEFTDDAFDWIAEGRWLADEAINTLTAQQSEGTLVDEADLGRSYLWGGIVYTYIPDWLEDFAFSDRAQSSPPIGEGNMGTVYDQAIDYLTQASSILTAQGENFNAAWAIAQRARAKHGKAVWQMMDGGSVPSNPLVGSGAGAEADALQALALVDASIDVPILVNFEFQYSAATFTHDMGFQVNSRLEHRFGNRYIVPTADDKRRESTKIEDPIDAGSPDKAADAILTRFEAGGGRVEDAPLVITSTREMFLIVAEARLAEGDIAGFTEAVNALRELNGKDTPYSAADHDSILEQMEFGFDGPTNLLIHSRLANLVMTGRILMDHHRFGFPSDFWLPQSIAFSSPGVVMPISIGERQSNECIQAGSC